MTQLNIKGIVNRYSPKTKSITFDNPADKDAKWYKLENFWESVDKSTLVGSEVEFLINDSVNKEITKFTTIKVGPKWTPPENGERKPSVSTYYNKEELYMKKHKLSLQFYNKQHIHNIKVAALKCAIESLQMSTEKYTVEKASPIIIQMARLFEGYIFDVEDKMLEEINLE